MAFRPLDLQINMNGLNHLSGALHRAENISAEASLKSDHLQKIQAREQKEQVGQTKASLDAGNGTAESSLQQSGMSNARETNRQTGRTRSNPTGPEKNHREEEKISSYQPLGAVTPGKSRELVPEATVEFFA